MNHRVCYHVSATVRKDSSSKHHKNSNLQLRKNRQKKGKQATKTCSTLHTGSLHTKHAASAEKESCAQKWCHEQCKSAASASCIIKVYQLCHGVHAHAKPVVVKYKRQPKRLRDNTKQLQKEVTQNNRTPQKITNYTVLQAECISAVQWTAQTAAHKIQNSAYGQRHLAL